MRTIAGDLASVVYNAWLTSASGTRRAVLEIDIKEIGELFVHEGELYAVASIEPAGMFDGALFADLVDERR